MVRFLTVLCLGILLLSPLPSQAYAPFTGYNRPTQQPESGAQNAPQQPMQQEAAPVQDYTQTAPVPAPQMQPAPDYAQAPVQPSAPMMPAQQTQPLVGTPSTSGQEYILGIGDRLRLTVYGEKDLSGDYEVGSTGIVAFPLIGDVPAAGSSLSSFERAVRDRLSQGYLKDPRVSAQVTNYRPFFILGEVTKPGSYPFVNNMTVVNAVALAGGYTYRANKNKITVVRASDPKKEEVRVAEDAIVMPGDILRVPERYF